MPLVSLVAMLALAAPAASHAHPTHPAHREKQDSCLIVYGKNWGFMAGVPHGWSSACGDRAMGESVLTLWPSDESTDALKAVMYVTVSGLGHESLDDFVKGDIEDATRHPATTSTAQNRQPREHVGKVQTLSPTRRLVHFQHAVGDRDELVEYVKGPTAYYIIVLTTQSAAMTRRYRPAFKTFVESFSPVTVNFEDGAKPPAAGH